MSRKKRFIENLAEQDVFILEQESKYSQSVDLRRHCQMILLSHKGYEVKQIVDIVGVCPQTVSSVFKAWEENGLEGLKRKQGQGRKAKLQLDNQSHVKAVKKVVSEHPQSVAKMLDEIYNHIEGLEPMSKMTLKRFLKKVAFDGKDAANG